MKCEQCQHYDTKAGEWIDDDGIDHDPGARRCYQCPPQSWMYKLMADFREKQSDGHPGASPRHVTGIYRSLTPGHWRRARASEINVS